ncbi:hypothetical protein MKZ38_008938 [Zalerion maritima]|uniref:Uncharacterized protein n=1 Tax=Zalerion maritima TaxID=339359 RepID=A0AAD5RGL9_9PEZI|nr:hypothetical protein MKZ38_008938 [Zalerion maritima]
MGYSKAAIRSSSVLRHIALLAGSALLIIGRTPNCTITLPNLYTVNDTSYDAFRDNIASKCPVLEISGSRLTFSNISNIDLSGIGKIYGIVELQSVYSPRTEGNNVMRVHSDTPSVMHYTDAAIYMEDGSSRPVVNELQLSFPNMSNFTGFATYKANLRSLDFDFGGDTGAENITAGKLSIYGANLTISTCFLRPSEASNTTTAGVVSSDTLASIKTLEIRDGRNIKEINFPSLNYFQFVDVRDMGLRSVDFIPGPMYFGNWPQDELGNYSISLPLLEEVVIGPVDSAGGIDNPYPKSQMHVWFSGSETLALPKLKTVKMAEGTPQTSQNETRKAALAIYSASDNFTSLDLGALESVEGYLNIVSNSNLSDVDIGKLVSVGGLNVEGNRLERFEAPELASVDDDLIFMDYWMEQLEMPKLRKVGGRIALYVNEGFDCGAWEDKWKQSLTMATNFYYGQMGSGDGLGDVLEGAVGNANWESYVDALMNIGRVAEILSRVIGSLPRLGISSKGSPALSWPHLTRSQTTTSNCVYDTNLVVNTTESYNSFRDDIAAQCPNLTLNGTLAGITFSGFTDIDLSGIVALFGQIYVDDTFDSDDVLRIHSDTLTSISARDSLMYGFQVNPRDGIYSGGSDIYRDGPLIKRFELSLPQLKDLSSVRTRYDGFRGFVFDVGGEVDLADDGEDEGITAHYMNIVASKATQLDLSPFTTIYALHLEWNRMAPQDDDSAHVVANSGVITGGDNLRNVTLLEIHDNSNVTAIEFPSLETVGYLAIYQNGPSASISFPSLRKSGAIELDNPNSTASFPELEEIEIHLIQFSGVFRPERADTVAGFSQLSSLELPKLRTIKLSGEPGTTDYLSVDATADLAISSMTKNFTALSLPSLERVEGVVHVSGNPSLASISLDSLAYVEGLELDSNDQLTSFSASELKEINGDLFIEAQSLTDLSMPKLETVAGTIEIRLGKVQQGGLSCEDFEEKMNETGAGGASITCSEDESDGGASLRDGGRRWGSLVVVLAGGVAMTMLM